MKNFWNSNRENFKIQPFRCLAVFFILSLFLTFHGCKEDVNSIGLNLKDRDDLLNAIFTDTITLSAFSICEDTLNTRNLSSNFLGFILDPVFGVTSTGIFTQFVPEGNSIYLGNSPQLDSIVLTLRYAGGFYGDTLNPFAIQVYQLTEDILSDEPYYQNKIFEHSSQNLTYDYDFHLYPKPKSKIMLDTLVEAQARIRLSDEIGNLLLQNTSKMTSNKDFINFFKGLYICAKPLSNSGSLVNFNLTSSITGMQLYYKNDTISSNLKFFIKSDETVRISSYEHDYTIGSQNFVNQVIHKDTLLGKDILFVQSMGGIKTKISFPFIKAFKDKNVVINKAELVITNIGEELSLFPPPNQLNLFRINKEGETKTLPDYGTTYWGGGYNETTKEYRFRITKFMQDIILRDDYQPFVYLVANRAAADANRLILNGTAPINSSSRLRLEIYYTEY